jgi:hypothetical protein
VLPKPLDTTVCEIISNTQKFDETITDDKPGPARFEGNELFIEDLLPLSTYAQTPNGGLRLGPSLKEGSFKICRLQVFGCDAKHSQRVVTFPLSNCRAYRLTLGSPDLFGCTVHQDL